MGKMSCAALCRKKIEEVTLCSNLIKNSSLSGYLYLQSSLFLRTIQLNITNDVLNLNRFS